MKCPKCQKKLETMYTDERGAFIVNHYKTCQCGVTVNERILKRKYRDKKID